MLIAARESLNQKLQFFDTFVVLQDGGKEEMAPL